MPNLVRVKLPTGVEVTVGEVFAQSHNLKPLDKPATDPHGRALPTKYPVDLRGKELDAALDRAGLSTSGSAQEKRERLSTHEASVGVVGGESTITGSDSPASPKED